MVVQNGSGFFLKKHGIYSVGSDDHTVRFWDVHSGDCIKVIHTHSVSALQFDDIYLYTASYDNTAACWDIDNGQLMCRYVGHISAVFSLDARRDLNLIVTGSADKTVKIWQLSSGALLNTLSEWHNDWITSLKILSHWSPANENEGIGHGTLNLVSVDRQCCCFWTIASNDQVSVSVTHTADWCMHVPFDTFSDGISVCTWNMRDRLQCLSTYTTETIDKKCSPRHMTSVLLPKELPSKQIVLGVGQKFSVFMVDDGYSRIVLVDVHSSKIVCSIPLPPFRYKLHVDHCLCS